MTRSSFSVCWDYNQKGVCPRGDGCKWTHERSLNVPVPDDSQFCWDYQRTGRCPRGSECRWIHELILLPWPSPSMVPIHAPLLPEGFPSTPESYWDQFDANQRLFGTTSTYDPSMSAYTTPLAMDSLTQEQIERAEQLSRIPLPSEKLSSQLNCAFCEESFKSIPELLSHIGHLVIGNSREAKDCPGHVQIKSLLKRKSWIVLQETLPGGFVSQVESLYSRQITSSTNLQMIFEAVRNASSIPTETKEYLENELVALVAVMASDASSADRTSSKKHLVVRTK